MSTSYSWKVNNLERTVVDGVVYVVHYSVSAADDTYQAGAYGSVGLDAPVEGYTVIPYADLTEEVVVGWVKSMLGAEQVTSVEAQLQAQLDGKQTETRTLQRTLAAQKESQAAAQHAHQAQISGLEANQTGGLFAWDGAVIPW